MWKVLICDDEAMTRRGLTRMIGHCRQDMEVVGAAAQGEEACAMIEQLRPSIVFMDINMPLVSGLEVIGALPRGSAAAICDHLRLQRL